MSKRAVRWTLGAICFVYAALMATQAIRIHAAQLQLIPEYRAGEDGGDGINDIYDVIDERLGEMGLLVGSVIATVLLIAWLRRRYPT